MDFLFCYEEANRVAMGQCIYLHSPSCGPGKSRISEFDKYDSLLRKILSNSYTP